MSSEGLKDYLDFRNLAHKNIELQPNDSLQVDEENLIDRRKSNNEAVKPLLPK